MALLTKDDLITQIYPEIVDVITRSNDAIVTKAIANGEEEAKAYLNRYDIPTMFGGTYNNELLKSKVLDLVCWHIIKLANPNIDIALFRTSYEDALKFFDKVQKGNIDPNFPLKVDDPTTPFPENGHISYSSNPKRRNHL